MKVKGGAIAISAPRHLHPRGHRRAEDHDSSVDYRAAAVINGRKLKSVKTVFAYRLRRCQAATRLKAREDIMSNQQTSWVIDSQTGSRRSSWITANDSAILAINSSWKYVLA